ncbi:MAG: hypothetical protein HC915_12545 [Anaerolineae bacterium]|nr:hypothetical protein [Anaerolineae bacterium]
MSQSLYTSNIIAESLQRLHQHKPEALPDNLEKLRILNRGALAEMRTLLLELRPEKLAASSMEELLQQLADAARARTGLSVEVQVQSALELPVAVKEALYRITQEALTNIIKHARASHVLVRYTGQAGEVRLMVEDDGQGFDLATASPGRMGIGNMQDRMAAVGGRVQIDAEVGGGTLVTATWAE